jgi:hypothetical protein
MPIHEQHFIVIITSLQLSIFDLDSVRVNSESVSNEIDERDLQSAKHDEQRI